MPRYDYYCEANEEVVEVIHGMTTKLTTWGELCECGGQDLGGTPPDAHIRRIFTAAPMANTPTGNSELKNNGWTRLEKRYDGTYENVTATGTEKKHLNPNDPSSLPHLHKKISD